MVKKSTPNLTDTIRYAHFSFLYSGTDAFPENETKQSSLLKSAPPTPWSVQSFYYPVSTTTTGDVWTLAYNDGITWVGADYCFVCGIDSKDDKYTRVKGNYQAKVSIIYGLNNNSGHLRKPIIISDAFDPGNMRDFYTDHNEFNGDNKIYDPRGLYEILSGVKSDWSIDPGANLAYELFQTGYDVLFVDYASGDGDIGSNAGSNKDVFIGVLEYLNSNYRDNLTEENIVVGPSMGGIITRMALTQMEKDGKEPHVKLWFSFDSPQEGAYIPLGLQYGVNFLQSRNIVDWMANGSLETAKEALHSPAARQMLLNLYTYRNPETGSGPEQCSYEYTAGNPDHVIFYNTMRTNGYPRYSKNIAISNGGTSLLYPDNSPYMTLDFHTDGTPWTRSGEVNASGYRQHNDANASYLLYHGDFFDGLDNDYNINLSGSIGYDNAPGGYATTLYTFNQTSNDHAPHCQDKAWCEKATFMPTVSAFGIIPTAANVHKTWDQISASETPFDTIHGMTYYGNEEHVRVTDKTSEWLQNDVLKEERKNIRKPYPRKTAYTETESKPCLYTATNSVIFGGASGSSFVIKSGADINIVAPHIIFKPGVKLEKGAKLSAKIGTVLNGSQKSAPANISKPAVTYLNPSPYNSKVYDYSEDDVHTYSKEWHANTSNLNIYPNPVTGSLTIEFIGQWTGETSVSISNALGQPFNSIVFHPVRLQVINMIQAPAGIYFVSIINGSRSYIQKIIKK